MIIWLRKPISEDDLAEVSFQEPHNPEEWERLCTPEHLSMEIEADLTRLSEEFIREDKLALANVALKMAKEIRKRAHIKINLH